MAMPRLVRPLVVTVVAVAATLVLPAYAAATLPHTKNHEIVPGKSIGGVNIGTKKTVAIAKWGSKPRCLPPDENGVEECLWEQPGSFGEGVYIQVWNTKVIVVGVSMYSLMPPTKVKFMSSFKTAKGIHLGSSMAAAMSKYPGMKPAKNGKGGPANAPFMELCKGTCTVFGGLGQKLEQISVSSVQLYR
jgi:hypothetical protein